MDIETYQKATEIMGRIEVCDALINVLETTTTYTSQKVRSALSNFAYEYGQDFAQYVLDLKKKEQEAFDALQCCSCDKETEEDKTPEENG